MQSSKLGMWKGKRLDLSAEHFPYKTFLSTHGVSYSSLSWFHLTRWSYRGVSRREDHTRDSRVSSVDEKFEGATPVSGHQYFCSERLTAWIWRNNKPGDWSEHCCRHHNRVSLGTKRTNVGSDMKKCEYGQKRFPRHFPCVRTSRSDQYQL